MRELLNKRELVGILERGLKGGCWCVRDFNPPGATPILPSAEFLQQHPQFSDMHFRDIEAYRRACQTNTIAF